LGRWRASIENHVIASTLFGNDSDLISRRQSDSRLARVDASWALKSSSDIGIDSSMVIDVADGSGC
jgi:hypothetical protein